MIAAMVAESFILGNFPFNEKAVCGFGSKGP